MKQDFERFDMQAPPRRMKWYLRPVASLLSYPDVISHRVKITKTGVDGIKPPFLLLCNHNAFMDFKVATAALNPVHPNYVVAIDGFIGREGLLRNVGCICKRKFTNDVTLVKQLIRVVNDGGVPAIYPEARYSLCGTTAVLPKSLGKLVKLLDVPVVTLICRGHHINAPFWNTKDHKVKGLEAELSLLFSKEDLEEKPVDEINKEINERFVYDDYAWAKEKGIKITYAKRAEGLDKVLYQCCDCGREFRMASEGDRLYCRECGHSWTMREDGSLKASDGETRFSHIPDWYEWERGNVRREVAAGRYSSGELKVFVRSLPNAKGYIDLGHGTMTHDKNGFTVRGKDSDGDPFEMIKDVNSLYSCHIEYNYLGKFGDCVDLNTNADTWYIYPEGNDFSVTKMALATEELYFAKNGI